MSIHPLGRSETIFFDDFHAGALDRSCWNIRTTRQVANQEQQAYIDSPKTLFVTQGEDALGATQNTALVFQPHYHAGFGSSAGNSVDFVSARIDTRDKVEFLYGTIAARMRLPKGDGLWSAFWAMGKEKWPKAGEIDIMENVGESDWVSAALHGPEYSGEAGLVNRYYLPSQSDTTDWHVYSVEWRPGQISFKLDDILYYRVNRTFVDFHGDWVFDQPKYLILNLAVGGIYPFKCNGITHPYYGLPVSTVEKIKLGKVRSLIDWVKITKLQEV